MQYHRQPLWYKDAIIYEVNIKGFYDSDGDGIGDFRGLTQKLDYLEDLGITAIWILPFYPSPLKDDGYDISDYYNISPAYGTLADFKEFLEEAHRRNLKVITELVINHTSDKHPWFQRARQAAPGSVERDYYVWSDTPDKYNEVRIIFQDFESSNWSWDPVAKAYYWHRFYSHQPDLNYDNPAVQEEIFRILDYWAEMGIDGFRLDAIPYLFERENTNCENLPETHTFLKKLRKHVDQHHDNILFLAEANMWPEDSASYFGDGDECHMNYHFPLMPRMYMAVKMEDRHPITDIFEQTPDIPEACQWATFLRNHDELTLEMVTDEERDFMYQVYAKDRTARINLGIRRRLAPLMDNDIDKIKLLNALLLSLPGTPVLYYGDEIGMGDNFYLGDRDGVRTPMQWDGSENAGFSDGNPHQLYLPVIRDPEYTYRSVNVKRQQQNQNSLFWWMKRILAKRKQHQVFGRGTARFLRPDNGKILAFIREHEEEMMLIVVSLSRYSEAVQLDLSEFAGYRLKEVFGRHYFPDIGREPYVLILSPHGYLWLQMEKHTTEVIPRRELETPVFDIPDYESFLAPKNRKVLEKELLPNFLQTVSWGGERTKYLENLELLYHRFLSFGEHHYAWIFFEVHYKEGLPEIIQLPIAFLPLSDDSNGEHKREDVLGTVRLAGDIYLLVDALTDEYFRRHLLDGLAEIVQNDRFKVSIRENFQLNGTQEAIYERSLPEYFMLHYRDFVAKFYRRTGILPPPDLEIKRILSEREYASAPRIMANLAFQPDRQADMTLYFIEDRLETQGGGWEYMIDQIRRLTENLSGLSGSGKLEEYERPDVSPYDEMRYQRMPELLQELLGTSFVVRVARLGRNVAAFHQTMADIADPAFGVEAFSLHYQRSLYSGLKSQVRATMDSLRRHRKDLPEMDRQPCDRLRDCENRILERLKRIFQQKINANKIRIHGDLTLINMAIVDDDFAILNFDGDPEQPFSQRRLLRSPAKDLASVIRSFDYAFRYVFKEDYGYARNNNEALIETWLKIAYRHLAAEFLTAYRNSVEGSGLLPNSEQDLRILIDTFMIEKALQELRYELYNRPEMACLPMHWLLSKV